MNHEHYPAVDKRTTRSTSRSSASVDDIVIRDGERVRLVFRPELVENPNDSAAGVRGTFLYLTLCLAATLEACSATPPASPDSEHYLCELYCSDAHYAQPGDCPNCDIPLRSHSTIEEKLELGKVAAILLFPGVQVIDLAGPHEVLGAAGFRVVTVAPQARTLRTDEGLAIQPDFDLESCPAFQVLVLPGGKIYPNDEIHRWIRERAARSEYVLSVCNGLAWVDAAGLADDATPVTTTATALARLTDTDRYRRDRRVVAADPIITSGGYTSGIDGALAIVARYRGDGAATLLGYKLEHEWKPDTSMYTERRSYYEVVRPLLRSLDRGLEGLGDIEITSADCGTHAAEVVWTGTAEAVRAIADQMEQMPEWSRVDAADLEWTQKRGEWSAELETGRDTVRLTVMDTRP